MCAGIPIQIELLFLFTFVTKLFVYLRFCPPFNAGIVIYHGVLSVNFSIDSCKWLLSDGRFHGKDLWQPYGCIIKQYNKIDTRICLRHRSINDEKNQIHNNNILFLGDSRIRQLFYEFINRTSSFPIQAARPVHHDINHLDAELRLNATFRWCPFVNESMFQIYRDIESEELQFKPKIIITGTASWTIKQSNASEEALNEFSSNLTKLLPLVHKVGQNTQVCIYSLFTVSMKTHRIIK